jgi:hypothetical protein
LAEDHVLSVVRNLALDAGFTGLAHALKLFWRYFYANEIMSFVRKKEILLKRPSKSAVHVGGISSMNARLYL